MISKKEIVRPLFLAISSALLSVLTLNPMIIVSSLDIFFMSDSEIGPMPLDTILNSAPSFFIFSISFSIASSDPDTLVLSRIGIIFISINLVVGVPSGVSTTKSFQFSAYSEASFLFLKVLNGVPILGILSKPQRRTGGDMEEISAISRLKFWIRRVEVN